MQFTSPNSVLFLAGLLAGIATAQPPPSDNPANPLRPTNALTSGITPLLPSVTGVTPSPSTNPSTTGGDEPSETEGGDEGDDSTDGASLPTAMPVAMLAPAVAVAVAMLL